MSPGWPDGALLIMMRLYGTLLGETHGARKSRMARLANWFRTGACLSQSVVPSTEKRRATQVTSHIDGLGLLSAVTG